MGLKVLEREKEVFKVNPKNQPDLDQYTYLIERQLKPCHHTSRTTSTQHIGAYSVELNDGQKITFLDTEK